MMLFPPREAMTTDEQTEPLYFSASRIHYMQTNSSEDWRPGGEAYWCPLVSIRGSNSSNHDVGKVILRNSALLAERHDDVIEVKRR